MMSAAPSDGDVLVRRSPNAPDSYTLSFVGDISQVCCAGSVNALALSKEIATATGAEVWFTEDSGTHHLVNRRCGP